MTLRLYLILSMSLWWAMIATGRASGVGEVPVKCRWGFLENQGQWPAGTLFRTAGSGFSLRFEQDGVSFMSAQEPDEHEEEEEDHEEHGEGLDEIYEYHVWKMHFSGGNPAAQVHKGAVVAARTNFFYGDDPSHWHTRVPEYDELIYREVWPGIDVRFFLEPGGRLKYEFLLAPEADPAHIRIGFEGLDGLEVLENGQLRLEHPWGPVIEDKPVAFTAGDHSDIPVQFRKTGPHSYGFQVDGEVPKGQGWIIDPLVLYWSTFANPTGNTTINYSFDVSYDAQGCLYSTGRADPTFPTTPGSYQSSPADGMEAFVARYAPDGSTLLAMTYIGGANFGPLGVEQAWSVSVSANGRVYVCGETNSFTFPTTPGALFTSPNYLFSPWVACFDQNLSTLIYSTILCNACRGGGKALKAVSDDEVIVSGTAYSNGFPTTPGAFQAANPGTSASPWVVRLNASGGAMVWSTFIGGDTMETVNDMAVNDLEEPYVVGRTNSGNFPVTPGVFGNFSGPRAYIARLNATGTGLVYSSKFGGYTAELMGVAVHPTSREAFVTGFETELVTNPPNQMVATPGAFQTNIAGGQDATVARISEDGSTMIYATFLGGLGGEQGNGIAVNSAGEAYVTGVTISPDFPVTTCQVQSAWGGNFDAFISHFTPQGDTFAQGGSTYLGGLGDDYYLSRINLREGPTADTLFCALTSHSLDFPTTPGSFTPVKPNSTGDCPVALKIVPDDFMQEDTVECLEDSIQVFAPTSADNVLWSTGQTTSSIWISQSGQYWVTGIRYNCPFTDTFQVVLSDLELDLGADTALCSNDSLIFLLSASGTGHSWAWSTGETSDTILVDSGGVYWVTALDTLTGCTISDTLEVTQNALPVIEVGDTAVCEGSSVQFHVDPAGNYPGASYLWSNNATGPQTTFQSNGWGWVELTSPQGCTTRDSFYLNLNPLPQPDLGPDVRLCDNEELTADAGPGYAAYLWSNSTTGQTAVFSQGGWIWVQVTDANGCVNRDSLLFEVGLLPAPDLGPDTTLCEGQSLTLIPLGNGIGYHFDWSTGATAAGITVNQAGIYTVEATEVSSGCVGTDTVEIALVPLPQPVLPPDTLLCDSTELDLYPGNFSSYSWSGGSGNPVLTVTESGLYSVTVRDSFGCESSAQSRVQFTQSPDPDLGPDLELCEEELHTFQVPRLPGNLYLWSDGGGGGSMTVTESGAYWVEISNECGIERDTVRVLFLGEKHGPFIPNAFHPGSNILENTIFRAIGDAVEDFRLSVFNRWGGLVYETHDINQGWDGTVGGKPAQEGVYVYVMQLRACDGRLVTRRGTVSLLR